MGMVSTVGLELHPQRDSKIAVDAIAEWATMVRRADLLAGHTTPVLGVNLSRLGFPAEIDVKDLAQALTSIDEHRYQVEPRMAVAAQLPDGQIATAVEVDGAVVARLEPGDRLEVTASRAAAKVVRLGNTTNTTFYERARRKLRVSGSAEAD